MDRTIPETMDVVEIAEAGGPEVLVPGSRPVPRPGAGEVLIRVAAAGVNRPDVMQRKGMYPAPPGASDLPGLEVAGTIVATGDGVDDLAVGDEICALVAGGGYAAYCVAPAPQCLPVPRDMDMTAAAGIPETFFTVWTNLFDRGRLAAGETVLVHGGSSGIGTTAIQLAVAFGAKVYVTAGNAEKCAACVELGAARAVNYREENFAAVIEQETTGRGVDVVLDMVGADYLDRNLKALAVEGRLVVIAVQSGFKTELNLLTVMQGRKTITGSTLRPRSVEEKGVIAAALREKVWPLLDSGKVRPLIHKTFPLTDAAAAHRLMEESSHIGKIVLAV